MIPDYTDFVKICNRVGKELLPPKPPRVADPVDDAQVAAARCATLRSSTRNVQAAQTKLKKTFDKCEDERIRQTLQTFESRAANDHLNAWKLVKELSGKKSGVVFIQGDDRLNAWKTHFSKLLSADIQDPGLSRPKIYHKFLPPNKILFALSSSKLK